MAKKDERKVCNSCGKSFTENGFYKVSQPNLYFPDGTIPICKRCSQELWNDPQHGFKNFIEFLRIADLPYYKDVYMGAKDKPEYIGVMRSARYIHYNFIDSDEFIEEKARRQVKNHKLQELTPEQIRECELFWGRGYSEDEYIYLMNEYADYNNEYDLSGKVMKTLIAQAVTLSLRIRKATEAGQDTSQLTKEYSNIIGNANLKPVQEKAAAENEANTFGTFIRKIEQEEPIPEPDEKYKDVDGIIKYVKSFFTNSMARSLGVEMPYPELQKEYVDKLTVDMKELEDELEGERDG